MVCKRLFTVQVNSVLEFMDMVMEMSQGACGQRQGSSGKIEL